MTGERRRRGKKSGVSAPFFVFPTRAQSHRLGGGRPRPQDDVLFTPVPYGPEPRTLGSQPVFLFETMAAALWMSKVVYCDGVLPDVRVEPRSERSKKRVAKKDMKRFFKEMGAKMGTDRIKRGGRERRSVDPKEEEEESVDDDLAKSSPDSASVASSPGSIPDVESQKPQPPSGFDLACETCYSSLSFTSRRVFETRTHAVRAVVMWSIEAGRVGVAFRGSKVGRNFATDAKFMRKRHEGMEARGKTAFGRWWTAPMVHSGFYNAYMSSGVEEAVVDFVKVKAAGEVTKRRAGETCVDYVTTSSLTP